MKKGKFQKKGSGFKAMALVLVLTMLFVGAIGGTIAWLMDKTTEVKNTFTTSNIDITLEETKPEGKTAKMIPGWTIDKDPTAKVLSGSEDCYLFVEITESENFDSFLDYDVADGWTPLTKDMNGEDISRLVYYRVVTSDGKLDGADVSKIGEAYSVLAGDKVTVLGDVDEKMMGALTENTYPTLSFIAYASQLYKSNDATFTAAEAWANIS